jgi:hypothetical protein
MKQQSHGLDVWNGAQPAPRSSGIRVSIDHFPKSCGPLEYHLRSIQRLKKQHGQDFVAENEMARNRGVSRTGYPLPQKPYTLHPATYTPPRIVAPDTLHTTPHTLHPAPCTLHPTPYTLHPTPHTPQRFVAPDTLRPIPPCFTLKPTPHPLPRTTYPRPPSPLPLPPNPYPLKTALETQ